MHLAAQDRRHLVVPKIGPFRPLAFQPLTSEAERLLLESLTASREAYRRWLAALRSGRLDLPDTDFDTGEPTEHSDNPLARETYAALLERLSDRKFASVSPELRAALNRYYAAPPTARVLDRKDRRRQEKAQRHLAGLNATATARSCESCARSRPSP
jgi:hypothetical protein